MSNKPSDEPSTPLPTDIPRVVLRAKRAQPFFGGHPWVFPGAIDIVEGSPNDGDEVALLSHARNFVAWGLFNNQSKIRVRLLSWEPDRRLDRDFFRSRLVEAIRLRRDVLGLESPEGACRLVFSEGDGLSGLTIDRYSEWLVVQFTSLGLASRRQMIVELLVELLNPRGIYLRTERGIGQLEGVSLQDSLLWGEPPPDDLTIVEHGVSFRVNLAEGQKTGFYLDQRDNRALVARYAQRKRVLDAFCYSGGFTLNAARGGAIMVEGIDVSEAALALARENAEANNFKNIHFTKADVFEHLTWLLEEGRTYDMVILDPPKFAREKQSIPEALKGYRHLYQAAIRLLETEGILVVCCCSGLILPEMLIELLAQVSIAESRIVQILGQLGQAPDHPVRPTCPESNYLKCLICRVL